MELDKLWQWEKRKLPCVIRSETGNPAADDLRERFAELAKTDLRELLSEMKTTIKKKEQEEKNVDHEAGRKLKLALNRSHILGATDQALKAMKKYDEIHKESVTQKNLKKTFTLLPKSPPRRVLLEIQRERSKPLTLPNPDENKAATAKLERKLAKQRAARLKKTQQQTTQEQEAMKLALSSSKDLFSITAVMREILREYHGDKFSSNGNYLGGMLYLSRMIDPKLKQSNNELPDTNNISSEQLIPKDGEGSQQGESGISEEDRQLGFNESTITDSGNAKLFCAIALCNWSRSASNAYRLASEGAVRAIMTLMLEPSIKIMKYCSAAFRFMSEHTPLAISIIEDNAIPVIADAINYGSDEFVRTNLMISLLNLTRVNGKEDKVVESGLVVTFTNTVVNFPESYGLCVRGLYNLTCVDQPYAQVDRVIRALVTLAAGGTANSKHICAAAFCNLSDLKAVRPRLVEEGCIAILGALARGAETRTRRICAVILQNLSASKQCRTEMVARSCVGVSYGLSSDQDPVILRCIGLTMSRISLEAANIGRIVSESGITALCNIAVKYPTIPGIAQPVAVALQLLSSRQAYRLNIVQEGSVTAIASLLRLSVDPYALQHSLLALCNILTEQQNHLPVVQQGLIVTLVTLCEQSNTVIKDLCALAFLNLSQAEESRKHVVNAGSVSAIITLSKTKSQVIQSRCAATLCYISGYETGIARMVSDGIIPALVGLVLSDDIQTVLYACAALCRLCSNVENALLIQNSGAIVHLVNRAIEGDAETKQYCGAVLSSLSSYESCRQTLSDSNMTAAMISLSEVLDETSKQRSLVAFANLSCEMNVHADMVQKGVVTIVANLANSYQEINFSCAAKTLCNLACSETNRMQVAKEGVQALMMIAMVHSVDMQTKLLCVLALSNLLSDDTVEFMLDEGIVGTVANLSRLPDTRTTYLCSQIFSRLSKYIEARTKIVDRNTPMNSLIYISENGNLDTETLAARTASNLVLCEQVRGRAIDHGALKIIEKGTLLEREASIQSLQALLYACLDVNYTLLMAKSSIPITLCKVMLESSGDKYDLTARILTNIAWNEKSRGFLQNFSFVEQLVSVINNNIQQNSLNWLALILRFVILGFTEINELSNVNITGAVTNMYNVLKETMVYGPKEPAYLDCIVSFVEIIRNLASEPSNIHALANPTTIDIFRRATQSMPNDDSTLYNVAVCYYYFTTDSITRRLIVSDDITQILTTISKLESCIDVCGALINLIMGDAKTRSLVTNETIALTLKSIIQFNNNQADEGTVYNCVSAIYSMSKLSHLQEMLVGGEVNIDHLLLRLNNTGSARVKAKCNRILKNITSESTEAIEEGAVATLIASSLEPGKVKNKVTDDTVPPEIFPLSYTGIKQPVGVYLDADPSTFMWFAEKVTAKGGAAGKGPDAPQPPLLNIDTSSEYPGMNEELEANEMEGKTKMAFAKMQVPPEMRNQHLLQDEDFEQKEDDDDEESTTKKEVPAPLPAEDEYLNEQNSTKNSPKSSPSVKNRKTIRNSPQSSPNTLSRKSLRGSGESSPANSSGSSPVASPKKVRNSNSFTSNSKESDSKDEKHADSPMAKKDSPKNDRKSMSKGVVAPSKEVKGPNSMQEKAAKLGLYN